MKYFKMKTIKMTANGWGNPVVNGKVYKIITVI